MKCNLFSWSESWKLTDSIIVLWAGRKPHSTVLRQTYCSGGDAGGGGEGVGVLFCFLCTSDEITLECCLILTSVLQKRCWKFLKGLWEDPWEWLDLERSKKQRKTASVSIYGELGQRKLYKLYTDKWNQRFVLFAFTGRKAAYSGFPIPSRNSFFFSTICCIKWKLQFCEEITVVRPSRACSAEIKGQGCTAA